jgi:lysophospholipase L1-like esterase
MTLRPQKVPNRNKWVLFIPWVGLLTAAAPGPAAGAKGGPVHWVGTWASSAQLASGEQAAPAAGFPDTTLRQVVRVSIGGARLRVRFSNAFGATPLTLGKAHVALPAGAGAIRKDTDRALAFRGERSVTIPPGASMLSDPLEYPLAPLSRLTVTVHLRGAPREITAHPGSRTTSYLVPGDAVSSLDLPGAMSVDHWYFLNGIDVAAAPDAAAVAILGDSITDGRGSTTNGNDRWTDHLAERLAADRRTSKVAVLNQGIGGNRLLGDGLGQNGLARLDRDVLAQAGVRYLVVLLGINDIGTRAAAAERGDPVPGAEQLIQGYEQIIERAHTHGVRVYGATLLPCGGHPTYFSAEGEAVRQAVNAWIRGGGRFDGVIDFDAALRDAQQPARLAPAADGGDHLHPGPTGHRMMGQAVDLRLFFRH